jgi:hypothetical protein
VGWDLLIQSWNFLVSNEGAMGFNLKENPAPMREMCKRNVLQAADQNNNGDKDALSTNKTVDPWDPPYDPCPPCKDWEESNGVL